MCFAQRSLLSAILVGLVGICSVAAQQQSGDPFGSDPFGTPRQEKKKKPPQPKVLMRAKPKAAATPLIGEPIDGGAVAHNRIRRALAQEIQLEFIDTPLSEVVDFLKDTAAIPILIDKRALDDIGMGSDAPVTISVKGVTMRSALKTMLNDLDLVYVIRDEVMKITSVEEAEQEMETRLYAVSEYAVEAEPAILVTGPPNRFELFENVLTTTIEPESWDDVGGPGSITPYGQWGFVAIAQTTEIHEQIEALLATLERARNASPQLSMKGFPVMSGADMKALERFEQALAQKTIWDFNEAPLEEVVDYIADAHEVPVLIDARALEDVGLGSDTPVTVTLEGITLRSALKLMLRDLDLTFVIKNEVLMITTPEVAENESDVYVYCVGDFWGVENNADDMVASRVDSLYRLITTSIAPRTWDSVGGAGSIETAVPWGQMIVSQTTEVHEQIAGLLSAARRVRKSDDTEGMRERQPRTVVTDDPFAANTPRAVKPQPTLQLRAYEIVREDVDLDEVVDLIQGTIAQHTWNTRASQGAIHAVGQRLFILQTPKVHGMINQLLSRAGLSRGMGGMGGGMGGGFF